MRRFFEKRCLFFRIEMTNINEEFLKSGMRGLEN